MIPEVVIDTNFYKFLALYIFNLKNQVLRERKCTVRGISLKTKNHSIIPLYSLASRLDRRVVADAFYWHEIEQEIRERKLDYSFKGTVDEMKDSFMEYIDGLRRKEKYIHTERDCSPMCKSKGE